MIINGKSLAEIANEESTTSHRIRMVTDLALLAPDILDAIGSGMQSEGLNTDRLIKSDIPANWLEQREIFAET
jgi:site-specific DNA recombinase